MKNMQEKNNYFQLALYNKTIIKMRSSINKALIIYFLTFLNKHRSL